MMIIMFESVCLITTFDLVLSLLETTKDKFFISFHFMLLISLLNSDLIEDKDDHYSAKSALNYIKENTEDPLENKRSVGIEHK